MTGDFRRELEEYRALVRSKDPVIMEKRRLASLSLQSGKEPWSSAKTFVSEQAEKEQLEMDEMHDRWQKGLPTDRASMHLERLLVLVDEQTNNEALWFEAQTMPEAYLQQELRRLHAAIEEEENDA